MNLARAGSSREADLSSHSTIFRYTFLYILFSALWIILSDWLVSAFARDLDTLTTISIAKGWLFVTITALFWHGVMARNAKKIMENLAEIESARKGETKALQDLRQSEVKFKTLVENSPDMITRFDTELRAIFVNRAVEAKMGLPAGRILGQTPHTIGKSTAEEVEPFERALHTIFETGKPVGFETSFTGPEGHIFLSSKGVPEFDEQEHVISALVIHRDITERKRRELLTAKHLDLVEFSHAHSLQEILEKTLDNVGDLTGSPIGFYHFVGQDQNSLILQAWTGRTSAEFCRAEGTGTTIPVERAGAWAECVAARKPVVRNDSFAAKDTVMVHRVLAVPILRGGRVVALLGVGNSATEYAGSEIEMVRYLADVSWEIVERKRADDERQRLESHLVRSQKMEAIGTLSSGIAHDFNNILNVIMGNASLIEGDPDEREMLHRRLDGIQKASRRAAQLVQQLLTFARKSDIERRMIDLNGLIREIGKLMEETFPKTVDIRLELDPAVPPLNADLNQLHQVFLNLSLNARDAMPQGGKCVIATGVVSGDEVKGRFPTAGAERYGLIRLKDTGTGMDNETVKQIFDPFFTTKEFGKGTGLGLAVVLGIVESHGGFIDVTSAPGAGTEFRVYLPITTGGTASADRPEATSVIAGGTETLLLIEDEELIRDALVQSLNFRGYTVLTASDGAEGVAMYRTERDRISIVLSDRGLPKLSGEQVWEKIRQINPNVPFMMLTGYIEPQLKDELLKSGVRSVMQKPFSPAELLRKIREVLDTR